ncbi:hypothetical protein LEP1GSC067_2688 [Leptospira interrogans serovar Lora str. TE 1992]|uniref:Uncharacterized protein n=1 Tax=Leptospira interrogans serovar Lora str. TE 1992 TaxID=1193028 RepID=M3ER56_LEPIR|nr:hypothetical protein LEP1GSC067_2688 [Leptospira interrogans serovar Lora str. TE 1992]
MDSLNKIRLIDAFVALTISSLAEVKEARKDQDDRIVRESRE